jgi:orotate phosphoribosyltransferase
MRLAVTKEAESSENLLHLEVPPLAVEFADDLARLSETALPVGPALIVQKSRRTRDARQVAMAAVKVSQREEQTAILLPAYSSEDFAFVRSINDMSESASVGRARVRPIVDARGNITWAGGSPEDRAELRDFYAGKRKVEVPPKPAVEEWLVNTGDQYLPKYPLSHMLSQLNAELRNIFQKGLESGAGWLIEGPFLTAGLRPIDVWIDADKMLTETCGLSVGAFVMARLVETAQPELDPLRCGVVSVASTSAGLRDSVGRCLGLFRPPMHMAGELGIDPPTQVPPLHPGDTAVVVTDVLLTENTIRSALAQLARWDVRVVAVVAVVDRRSGVGPIQFAGRSIPTVAAIAHPINGARILGPAPLDPGERPGEIVRPPKALSIPLRHSIEKDSLIEQAIAADCFRFGHFEGSKSRHLSTYVSGPRLYENEGGGDNVMVELIHSIIQEWVSRLRPSVRSLVVYVPEDSGPATRNKLIGRLNQALPEVEVFMIEVGDSHVEEVPHKTGERVAVAFDWGAITARTLRRLVLQAAGDENDSILAVVVVSQLLDDEERFFGRARSLHDLELDSSVPIQFRFIAKYRSVVSLARTCELCRLANEYRRSSITVGTPLLANAALTWVEALGVRSLNSALNGAAVDLFNEHLDGDSLRRISRIRTMLEQAEFSTKFRELLHGRLAECLAGWPDGSVAIGTEDETIASRVWAQAFIRILTVEPHRLNGPHYSSGWSEKLLLRFASNCLPRDRRFPTKWRFNAWPSSDEHRSGP